MLTSKVVAGNHTGFKCSHCHTSIHESNRLAKECSICHQPFIGERGIDDVICINKINGSCASLNCKHGRPHKCESRCQLHTCDIFNRIVQCVLVDSDSSSWKKFR